MLKKIFRRIWRILKALIKAPFWYGRDFFRYRAMLKRENVRTPFYILPLVFDRDPKAHTFDKHYVYMDRWAFKLLQNSRPISHVDIGSSIRFLSMASTVAHTTFVDIRPVKPDFDNFEVTEGSILAMPYPDNFLKSLSCLHVAEHIGLGRYGDPLNPLGTQKACLELARILAPGGKLYFALPVGKSVTYFNAHRVHSPKTILEYFSGLKLLSFSAVGDDGRYYENVQWQNYEQAWYVCGMFEFTK